MLGNNYFFHEMFTVERKKRSVDPPKMAGMNLAAQFR